ncbi:helix-turn-helix domain-containing protein [Pseudomonas sp. 21LCFQ02]|uniref:XRE family transcriptional regulator n=1 Tax=unclassified Pseudomonas TaxID=196821 RepID=UPI0004F695BD|nr:MULTISPECIES: XRE family transcriptional regulator [unclassified Pseudomonas]MCO8162832.1 helix-turn-helix domain-containing protein [Pseudomonas sp. 21LCFQ010]MCO8170229.1 helix-turn-helix domain-containing protein [Pseudomonas sp. 21LCFQ02]BAP43342.1 Ata-like protein [Pseudomonas sp. StFLB209]
MSGKKSFSSLQKNMSEASQARVAEKTEVLRMQMDLSELRRARRLSQESLAQSLHVNQASVAKMEKRTDMYISSLRRFIQAMGGELEVTARFPDHSVRINQFSELDAV